MGRVQEPEEGAAPGTDAYAAYAAAEVALDKALFAYGRAISPGAKIAAEIAVAAAETTAAAARSAYTGRHRADRGVSEDLRRAMDVAARSLVPTLTDKEAWIVAFNMLRIDQGVPGPAKSAIAELEAVRDDIAALPIESVRILLGRVYMVSDLSHVEQMNYAERSALVLAVNQGWVAVDAYERGRAAVIGALRKAGPQATRSAIPYLMLLLRV
jgi:hypothetical protein